VLLTFWSVKGGSGTTVVAAAVAGAAARRAGRALLVDLRGDQPAAVGVAEPTGPGVRDWLAADGRTPDALERLVLAVDDRLGLLPQGTPGPWPNGRHDELVEALQRTGGAVVVDAGAIDPIVWRGSATGAEGSRAGPEALAAGLAAAGTSLLVLRPCYLALRRAVRAGGRADGVVLVVEPGRALGRRDVEQVLDAPVVATVELDPSVARAVDAGLLVRRPQRGLERSLRGVA